MEPLLVAARNNGLAADETLWVFHPLAEQRVPRGRKSWKTLLDHGEEEWVRFDDLETSKRTVVARFFSSGTTGLPKATCNTHYNLVAQHELVLEGANKRPYDIVNLYALPLFHVAVSPRTFTGSLKTGFKTYIMRRFDVEKYLEYCERYKVTDAYTVPPMAIAIMNSPFSKLYSMKSAKMGTVGAAPLRKEPVARFRALLGEGKPFTQIYGMTEASCCVTMLPYPEHDETGSVGRFLPNLDAKLVDDDGKDISAYDVEGELCIRGPTVIPGYFENPKANRESFDADGFYHSGDIGYCSSMTKLWYIVDRKKELIKVRSFQVAPPEIEGVLLDHPDIVDAAVIGVQAHEEASELPRAYVVRRPGCDATKLTEEEVKEFVGQRLAKFKRPEGGVVFVDVIPKNASGKILKRVLREQAMMESGRTGAKL
ncbi:hypothetical protein LTR16_000234 [Cryomyces antarcticus]|uniref:AMP-dependent synthetase/ligase domain-containing protein n=1 Tax=Cryomyces antarcticus TaxID=329879 RepID=A0ABR0LR66_9PEZI|nr:hypothetical protein LTR39_000085 [Cryomyces antarcticus]KAK5021372.1 hypothetical protein LTR60_000039 [Cryomyces antarcticus]KAK5202151.1 hypothetical protein LTR16_000234 [Cryomyces antarcticus]